MKHDPRIKESGPFDEKIKNLINEIIERFKAEKEVAVLRELLLKSLEYNPENRINWTIFRNFTRKLYSNKPEDMPSKEEVKEECRNCDVKSKEIEKFKKIIERTKSSVNKKI